MVSDITIWLSLVVRFEIISCWSLPPTRLYTNGKGPMRAIKELNLRYTVLDLISGKEIVSHLSDIKSNDFDSAVTDPVVIIRNTVVIIRNTVVIIRNTVVIIRNIVVIIIIWSTVVIIRHHTDNPKGSLYMEFQVIYLD